MPDPGTEPARSAATGARSDLRERYERWSDSYDADVSRYGWCAPARLHAAISRHLDLAPHLRVVDLGVGTGQASAPFLEVGARVIGLDLSPAMLARAARERPGFFRLVEHDLDRDLAEAGLHPGSHDLVVGCGVLHFVRDLEGMIGQCARLLDPGGVLAFTYIAPQERRFSAATRVRTPGEVERWIDAVGLELLEHEEFVAYREGGGDGEPVRYHLAVARDRRPRPGLEGPLARLDRTACVDRARIHRVAGAAAFRAEGRARGAAPETSALRAALHEQVRTGEIGLDELPWSVLGPPSERAPGSDVVVVLAHPDDESIYVGGTLAALAAAGHQVHLLSLTDGAGGRGGEGSNLAALRERELTAAARSLGLSSVEVLGFDDFGKHRDEARTCPFTAADTLGRWGVDETIDAIAGALRRYRPRAVLTFAPDRDPNYSLHGHHLAVGLAAIAGALVASDPSVDTVHGPPWRVSAVWTSVAPEEAGRDGVRVDHCAADKARAVACHETQAFSSRRLLEALEEPGAVASEGWTLALGVAFAGPGAPPLERLAGRPVRARALPLLEGSITRRLLSRDPELLELTGLAGDRAGPVVTGQQVGVFGGPALTLLKAAGAVAEARRRGVAAKFWMATQDHDLDEVACFAVSAPGGLRRLRWDPTPTGGPVGRIVFGDEIVALKSALLDALGAAPFVREVSEALDRHYSPGRILGQAFGGLLGELLPALELVEPDDEAAARASAPLVRRILEDPTLVLEALARRRAALRELGLEAPIDRGADTLPVFVLDARGRRRALRWSSSSGFRLADGEAVSVEDLLGWLDDAPSRFSPDVLLRPAVQDLLLGTSVYVGGPSELAYWSQATALHELLGVEPAALRLRPHLGLLEAHELVSLESYGGASLSTVLDRIDAGEDPFTAPSDGSGVDAARRALAIARDALVGASDHGPGRLRAIADGLAPVLVGLRQAPGRLGETTRSVEARVAGASICVALERAAEQLDRERPGTPGSRRAVGVAIRALTRLEKAIDATRRRATAPARAAAARLRPQGRPQDRTLALVELVARFGPDLGRQLVDLLAAGPRPLEDRERMVVLEPARAAGGSS